MSNKAKPDNAEEDRNVPTEDRSCTDILCCLLFIAAIAAFLSIFGIGIHNGKPKMIFAVWDSSGRPCGMDFTGNITTSNATGNYSQVLNSRLANYPYLYFPKPYVFF